MVSQKNKDLVNLVSNKRKLIGWIERSLNHMCLLCYEIPVMELSPKEMNP